MRSPGLNRLPTLLSLRASLLAALGLAACSTEVVTPAGHGGGGSGAGGSAPAVCAGATPVPALGGGKSGFARCPDGTIHRVEVAACDPSAGIVACAGTEASISCKTDAECTSAPHGRCASYMTQDFSGPISACGCVYPCASDEECGAGNVCVCAGVTPTDYTWSSCAAAKCVTGNDCPSGECGLSSFYNGCSTDVELECRSALDPCRVDSQCPAGSSQKCVAASGAPWACSGSTCAIGRPLMVSGEARTAAAIERSDWTAQGISPVLAGLTQPDREPIAKHWMMVAALEHASVASFARFTLELMALGAPAGLLTDAQRAGADEVEHARQAYAIASAYAGRPLGPSVLSLTSVQIRSDLREILRSVIVEGCVGETLGVAEACDLAERVRDPALRRVHARVAVDEQRHAELSWRALAWMLEGASEELVRHAERCFEEATELFSMDPPPPSQVATEHGLLSAPELGELRRRAIRMVIAPCAVALLDAAKGARLAKPLETPALQA